jgi:hypothetical protein
MALSTQDLRVLKQVGKLCRRVKGATVGGPRDGVEAMPRSCDTKAYWLDVLSSYRASPAWTLYERPIRPIFRSEFSGQEGMHDS